jgi:hypothetical protein
MPDRAMPTVRRSSGPDFVTGSDARRHNRDQPSGAALDARTLPADCLCRRFRGGRTRARAVTRVRSYCPPR